MSYCVPMMSRRPYIFLSVLFLACIASSAILIPIRAAEPLPSKLSDEAFWKMITDFSEEGGYFRFENFLSNELGFQLVIPQLKEITKPGGVYLGVGPEQNFTYITALEPKIAFITDIRRQNMLELMMYRAFFELSPDRGDFLSRLFARKRPAHLAAKSTPDQLFASYGGVQPDPLLFKQNIQDAKNLLVKQHKFGLSEEDLSNIEYVYRVFVDAGPDLDYQVGGGFGGGGGSPTYAELMTMTDGQGKNRSYLATQENYLFMREMEMNNLIVPLVGDFGGAKAIRTVGQYLKDHDAKVTAFYLSNVEQYLFQDSGWRRFYANVATLPIDDSSQFIRTVNGGNGRGFRSFGMRFQTLLSPIGDVVDEFQKGQLRNYNDVIRLSRQ